MSPVLCALPATPRDTLRGHDHSHSHDQSCPCPEGGEVRMDPRSPDIPHIITVEDVAARVHELVEIPEEYGVPSTGVISFQGIEDGHLTVLEDAGVANSPRSTVTPTNSFPSGGSRRSPASTRRAPTRTTRRIRIPSSRSSWPTDATSIPVKLVTLGRHSFGVGRPL